MNSRDIILSAINHKRPDKVPVDLGSSTVTGISAIAYNNLKSHLKITSPTRVFDVVQQLANVDMEIIDLFGIDALDINRVVAETDDWYGVDLADGSIKQYIPDLIEVGFDILNPVQTNCYDMDPYTLKKEYGKDITFWGGGVDTSSVLNQGRPEDVRKDVLNRCDIFSKDGGFVFAPIHNILSEVPPQNIIAAYNAVKEFNGDNLIKV